MSAYEQRREAPDRSVQYLLFAASPYETIAFKIPATEIDRDPSKFYTHWDADRKSFTLQLYFKAQQSA
jgi:splicing factor 3A subunit 2